MHIVSDIPKIRDDPHTNMLIGLIMIYFYSAAATWVTCEAHATFKAFTSGIISARNKVYFPFGYGTPFIPLGILMIFFNDNLGTEPRCFIAWDELTKTVFFIYLMAVTICGVTFAIVVRFNLTKPQTRRTNVIPDLTSQAKGTMAASGAMLVFWSFGFYVYVRKQQSELPDLYCYFSIVLGWFGILMFVFYGVLSQRFRKGILGKYSKYQQELRYVVSSKKTTDDATSELGTSFSENANSPSASRPATAKSSLHEEPIQVGEQDAEHGETDEDAVSKKSNASGDGGSDEPGSDGEDN